MAAFAVYFVPDAQDPLYHLGTSILGFDIRAGAMVSAPSDAPEHGDRFDQAWATVARLFGFHLTITEALDCEMSTISHVEDEIGRLLACFDPAHLFQLYRPDDFPVGIWGEEGRPSLVLRYQPNEWLRMLHTLLVARVNPLGSGSVFLRRYLETPGSEAPHRAQQTRLFGSPTVLDNWYPHFTVLNPYTGEEVATMATRLALLFAPY